MVRFRFESRLRIEFRDRRLDAGVAVEGAIAARPRLRDHASDLATELAHYTTPAELLDLHAMLDRHEDEDTEEVRSILAKQALNRAREFAVEWPLR